jgi:capsular polysaccharide biosynthesis protein
MNRTGIINVVAIGPVWADPNPVKPNTSLLMKLAIGMGLIVAIGFGFVLEILDHRLKSDSDAESYLGVPVLTALDQYDSAEIHVLEPSV